MSSAAAVAIAKRRAGRVKTGHAGTLDPLATGVLVLALGSATKSISKVMASDKRYRTVIDLSAFTTTDDAEGERQDVACEDPPSARRPSRCLLAARFIGSIMQTPPAYSAVKVGRAARVCDGPRRG